MIVQMHEGWGWFLAMVLTSEDPTALGCVAGLGSIRFGWTFPLSDSKMGITGWKRIPGYILAIVFSAFGLFALYYHLILRAS